MSSEIVAFEGEVMLVGWDEKHNVGRTARFLFDEEGPEHPMKQHTARRGKQAGTRFMMVLVELHDDDSPVNQKQREVVEGVDRERKRHEEDLKGGPLSKNAGMLCNDPEFQRYVSRVMGFAPDVHGATEAVYTVCHISSRKLLDHEPEAAQAYEMLKAKFLDWSEEKAHG